MSTAASPFPGERVSSYDITGRQNSDYYAVFSDIPAADRAAWDRAKAYIDEIAPQMADAWDRAEYPLEAARRMGEMDLVVDGVQHPALTSLSPLAAGLVNMEISRGDGSLGTILAVQGGLALRTLALFGSPAQQEKWLTRVADGSVLGSFALTEPDHGSDSVSLETVARRDGDEWVIRGRRSGSGTAPPAASRSSGRASTTRAPRSTALCGASSWNRTPPATPAA